MPAILNSRIGSCLVSIPPSLSTHGQLVVFFGSPDLSTPVTIIDAETANAKVLLQSHISPSIATGSSCIATSISSEFLCFGGVDTSANLLNELWMMRLNSTNMGQQQVEWILISNTSSSNTPSPRKYAQVNK